MTSINDSQPEVNQEIEAAVALESKKNDYNVSQNSNGSTLPKSISREDAHYSSDPLLADNFANPDKVTKETNSVRRLLILENIVLLSVLRMFYEFYTQKF